MLTSANTYYTVSYWTWVVGKYDHPQQPRCRAALSRNHCLFDTAHPASAHMRTSRIPLLQQQNSKSWSPEQFFTTYRIQTDDKQSCFAFSFPEFVIHITPPKANPCVLITEDGEHVNGKPKPQCEASCRGLHG